MSLFGWRRSVYRPVPAVGGENRSANGDQAVLHTAQEDTLGKGRRVYIPMGDTMYRQRSSGSRQRRRRKRRRQGARA